MTQLGQLSGSFHTVLEVKVMHAVGADQDRRAVRLDSYFEQTVG